MNALSGFFQSSSTRQRVYIAQYILANSIKPMHKMRLNFIRHSGKTNVDHHGNDLSTSEPKSI